MKGSGSGHWIRRFTEAFKQLIGWRNDGEYTIKPNTVFTVSTRAD
jgi:hypothetical protein